MKIEITIKEEKIPAWVRYIAVDACGSVWWYEYAPTLSQGVWNCQGRTRRATVTSVDNRLSMVSVNR